VSLREVRARAVFDSNGVPAVEVEVTTSDGVRAAAIAPRGSTTGQFEAGVLEDADGLPGLATVAPALAVVRDEVTPAVLGMDITDQRAVDTVLRELDGGVYFRRIGGNVAVATSMAVASAGALTTGRPLYRHLAEGEPERLPRPMFNIADGAVGSNTVYTEFLHLPSVADPATALDQAARLRVAVADGLRGAGYRCADSTQGGWSLDLGGCEATMDVLVAAAEQCGLVPDVDFHLGLDLSGAEFATAGGYAFPWLAEPVKSDELIDLFADWARRYPLVFLEDAFTPTDEDAWRGLRQRLSGRVEVVGDDLFASRADRISHGALAGLADGALVKPNQVGTVTQALDALATAHAHGLSTVVSQRSGENDGAFITHLAVAGRARWLKAGGLSRMDRVAKYNELLRIAEGALV
jgi:enolase